VDPATKKCLTSHSTRKKSRDEALLVVYDWLKNGIPKKQPREKMPLKEELTVEQTLDSLKTSTLTGQDVSRIEKILKNQGLITMIVQKNSPSPQGSIEFLKNFWTYETSPYAEEKLSHKINIGKTYVILSYERVKLYWEEYFQGVTLGEVSRKMIGEFSSYLSQNYSSLASNTLKGIIKVGVTALRWAFANEYIPADPTIRLPEYSSKQKDRGVLNPKEAMELFRQEWKDYRSYLINLVAMTTGLRVGEIIALKAEDVGEKYLSVDHSFSYYDGLKSTKTETPRVVPIVPGIRDALRKLGEQNPYGDGFIFYSVKPGVPIINSVPREALRSELVKLRIGSAKLAGYKIRKGDSQEEKERKITEKREAKKEANRYWKERNVVFHSWRHFYASRMTDRLEARKVMLATGHKTEAVFKKYSDRGVESDLLEVASTTGDVFGGILHEAITVKEEGGVAG
jgi:integrase